MNLFCFGIIDTRVADWPLMSSPLGTILLDIAYLIVVIGGLRFMKNRQPFGLKPIVAIHNLLLVAVSGYMTFELFRLGVYEAGYGLCDSVDYSPATVGVRFPITCNHFLHPRDKRLPKNFCRRALKETSLALRCSSLRSYGSSTTQKSSSFSILYVFK